MAGYILKNKNRIIIFGALAVTVLMNFQRVLVVFLAKDEFTTLTGLTIKTVILRMLLIFMYAYLLLSFNVIWKDKWQLSRFVRFAVNLGLFISTVIVTTRIMIHLLTNSLENWQVFVVTLTNFLIVHPILLLLASFIKLSFQQQQNILEKEQAKQQALQHQLAALRAQINPHFLFNTLNSLTVLIRTKPERALPFIDQLSWLLRATLLRSEDDFITVQNELEYLESYIYLQKERFGEKFNVHVQIPEHWKKELIPSFSLQLLAENAINHNVVSKNQPLLEHVWISLKWLKSVYFAQLCPNFCIRKHSYAEKNWVNLNEIYSFLSHSEKPKHALIRNLSKWNTSNYSKSN